MYCELVMLVRMAYSRFSEYWRPPKTRLEVATDYFYELVSSTTPCQGILAVNVFIAFFLVLTFLYFRKCCTHESLKTQMKNEQLKKSAAIESTEMEWNKQTLLQKCSPTETCSTCPTGSQGAGSINTFAVEDINCDLPSSTPKSALSCRTETTNTSTSEVPDISARNLGSCSPSQARTFYILNSSLPTFQSSSSSSSNSSSDYLSDQGSPEATQTTTTDLSTVSESTSLSAFEFTWTELKTSAGGYASSSYSPLPTSGMLIDKIKNMPQQDDLINENQSGDQTKSQTKSREGNNGTEYIEEVDVGIIVSEVPQLSEEQIEILEQSVSKKILESQRGLSCIDKTLPPQSAATIIKPLIKPVLNKNKICELGFNLHRRVGTHQWGLTPLTQQLIREITPPGSPPSVSTKMNVEVPLLIDRQVASLKLNFEKNGTQAQTNFPLGQRSIIIQKPSALGGSNVNEENQQYFEIIFNKNETLNKQTIEYLELLLWKKIVQHEHDSFENGKRLIEEVCTSQLIIHKFDIPIFDKDKFLIAEENFESRRILFLEPDNIRTAMQTESMEIIKKQLEVHIAKKFFEIKFPSIVQQSISIVHKAPPKKLNKLILPGRGIKKPRPQYIPFIEQNVVDHLELNLKHKYISHLWGYRTLFEKSTEIMVPKAPPIIKFPLIKASGNQIEPMDVETGFIGDEIRGNFERHITEKKLEHMWCLPLYLQRSMESFVPPAPKLIPSQLSPKPYIDIVVTPTRLPFVTEEHKKTVEMNVKKRIVSCKLGIPNIIQQSISSFMVPAPSIKDVMLQSEIKKGSGTIKTDIRNNVKVIPDQIDFCQTESKTISSTQSQRSNRNSKPKKVGETSIASLEPKCKDKLAVCLTKECVAVKMDYLPPTVKELYKTSYPLSIKAFVPKLIPPGRGYKKTRPLYLPFIEKDAVDRLEMNLKHRLVSNFLGFPSPYEESLEMMIPKAPPLPPQIKTAGVKIEPRDMETNFMEDVRNNLEIHTTQKKRQFNWGLPLDIQRSVNALVSPSPKLVLSQLRPQSYLDTVPLKLAFISKEHKKLLENNMQKRIVNCKWDLPKLVQKPFYSFMASPPINELAEKSQTVEGSKILPNNTDPYPEKLQLSKSKKMSSPKHKTNQRNVKPNQIRVSVFESLCPECRDELDMCLTKQCLDIKLDYLPEVVKEMYKFSYSPETTKTLAKPIASGRGYKKLRRSYIPFMEQDAVIRLEMNFIQKNISHLLGFSTLSEISMAAMIPEAPTATPSIKECNAKIEPIAAETSFISHEARLNLEWHIKQKKLQQDWGLPLYLQKSQEAFIPPASKLIPSQLKLQSDFITNVVPIELVFLSAEHQKTLELNVKKRLINRKWGLPNLIQMSLMSYLTPAPSITEFLSCSEKTKENEVLSNTIKMADSENTLLQVKNCSLLRYESEEDRRQIQHKVIGRSFPLVNLKPEYKDKLDMCLTKQCLEIKMNVVPEIVKYYYKNSYIPARKKVLPKLIAPGEGFKTKRPQYILFIEQSAVNHVEMNLKNLHISQLWGFPTLFEKSMEMMIPKAPPVPPASKAIVAQIEPEHTETTFIANEARSKLEWHVTQKKLQYNWGVPVYFQQSTEASIPPPPKLVLSQLTPKLDFIAVIAPSDLPFLSVETRNLLELNTKKRIINRRWGLPKLVQFSMRDFIPSGPAMNDIMMGLEMIKNGKSISDDIVELRHSKSSSTRSAVLSETEKFSAPYEKHREKIKPTNIDAYLKQKDKDKLDVCLTKQCLAIKMDCLPEIIKEFYKKSYPPTLKIIHSKPILPGKVSKKLRPLFLPFIEQVTVDCLELNLKHKQIDHLWGLETECEKSMKIMVPKGPPIPPPFKANLIQIEPISKETAFIDDEARDNLERHILQKKLQYTWGLPLNLQRSREAFIPPVPKLIQFQVTPQSDYVIFTVPTELQFLNDDHKKILERNIKKKIIHCKWGLPRFIQSSLNNYTAPAPSWQDLMLHSDGIKEYKKTLSTIDIEISNKMVPLSTNLKNEREKQFLQQYEKRLSIKTLNKKADVSAFAGVKPNYKDRLDVCLYKQRLEIKMEYLPEIVTQMYKITYSPPPKKPLPKIILYGEGFKKPRSLYIPFIEQGAVDCLELNLKHKQIVNLWGLATPYEETADLIIPKGPPMPSSIKASGARIEPTQVKITFIEDEAREGLEWHITQKILEHNWDVPLHVQKSVEAFIPQAPKLIPTQLFPQPDFVAVVASTELAFVSNEHLKTLELNTKKKIISHKWVLPNIVESSLRNFMAPAPSKQDLMLQPGGIKEHKQISSPTAIEITSKMVPLSTDLKDKREKLSLQQYERRLSIKTLNKKADVSAFAGVKPNYKDKLDVCLYKQRLEIKMEYLPEIVTQMYKITYSPPPKKPLPKIILYGEGFKKPRSLYIPFIEQGAVDCLELNLKHKQIVNLWGLATPYEETADLIIPKGPPMPSSIKASGARIEPTQVKITFIEDEAREGLEWHITQKILEHNWDVPLHVQKSVEAFIPQAPKLIPTQLFPQPDFVAVVTSTELAFVSNEHLKTLELNTKKKIISHKWGLPNIIESSLRNFIIPPPADFMLQSKKEILSNNNVIYNFKMADFPGTCLGKKNGKLGSPQYQRNLKNENLKTLQEVSILSRFKPQCKDYLEICLLKQSLNIKMEYLPEMVNDFYKNTYPSVSKKHLPKLIANGEGYKKQRTYYLTFIEQDSVDRLEMKLKHKQIFHLWSLETPYEESLELMIPNGPPLPPPLRSFGSQIDPVHMETSFIEEDARDRLEWHIIQQKLQYHWGLPLCIQTSHEAFIPQAPKLIPSQLNPPLDFVPLTSPMELMFLTDEHRKLLEMITKKKIINRKWGLPTLIESSLRNFMAASPSKIDLMLQFEMEEKSKITSSDINIARNNQTVLQESLLQAKIRRMPLQYDNGSKSIKLNNTAEATILAHQKPECQHKIIVCLLKQSLEIKMNCLPEIVKQLYKDNYPPVSKKPLIKIIAPGEVFKKPRSSYICFIEQDAVDRIELNLKHRQISNLWGVSTLFEKSMEIMISKGPPVPPAIKSAIVQREPVNTETTFFEEEARDILERHITQKRLQHNWGLPTHVQRSLEAFILSAPKLIPSHLTVQPEFAIMVAPNELSFIGAEHKKILELNTKKKIINRKHALPKLIQISLSIFMAPAPVMYSNIDEGNKTMQMVAKGTFLQNKKRKLIPQSEKESKSMKKIEKRLCFDDQKPEYKDKLHMCLIKQNLEIKLEYFPEMVQLLYRNTYRSASKNQLPKLIVSGEGFKKPRPSYLPFMEQYGIDRIELNLKHRQIIHLWGLETEYEESMEWMICKGPSLPPVIKPSGAQIEPMAMEITFIDDESRNGLEWHITQKKLQYNWGLPLDFQRSLEAFIAPAPKLIPSQLNQQSHFVFVFSPPELNFISCEHQKILEFNSKKRIINYKWGIPKPIKASLRMFMVPPPSIDVFLPQRQLVERNSPTSNLIHFGDENIDTLLFKRGNIWLKQPRRDSGNIKLNHTGMFNLPILRPEFKDKLTMFFIKHCLEIKMNFFPEIVNMFYKDTYPSASNIFLPKLVAAGDGFKKARSSYIPFIEQDSVDRLELNLKHRQIINLWGLETEYEKSIKMMIPKGPPVPPTFLSSGAQVEQVGMEITFIEVQTRDNLERHITLKKLQQSWGLPLNVQRSLEAFISPAPKFILSQLNPQPGIVVVVVPADLSFLRNEYRKTLEMNTRKKIINRKWGLPNLIELSLKNFMPKAPPITVLMLHSQMIEERPMMVVPYPGGVLIKTGTLSSPKYHRTRNIISKMNGEVNYFDILKPKCKGKLEICLIKQHLEIKMKYLPELVKKMYRSTYLPVSKKLLPKCIAPSEGLKKSRSTYIPFIEQEAIDHLELNLKHKQISNLLGLPTLFEISTEMMISRGPPVAPAIIPSRAQIEPKGMETIWIENEKREKLEWHITQIKLQLNWGSPQYVQISQEAFIPPAPKLIPSQLKYKPNFALLITHSELTFLSEEHIKKLELNTKKRIINQKWGLPNVIQSSLKNFMSPAPKNIHFIVHSKNVDIKAMSSNTEIINNLKMFSHGSFLGLKGGKLPLLQYEIDSKNIKLCKLPEIYANFKPEYKAQLEICLTKQCLEIKMYHLPKLVSELYKSSYPSATNKSLPKFIVPGKGHRKSRPRYISFIEQVDIDHIEMNLKHRQILYLWGLETPYEKSMKMLIPQGPPVTPPIKARETQIEPVGAKAMFICDEVRNTLEWHIMRKKLQLTWDLPLHFQNSAHAFVPSAPKLILSQLKSHPGSDIIVSTTDASFISDDHKRVLEINIKKKNVNHRWGLPRLIQSSLNEFIPPPPPIKDLMMHLKILEEKVRSNDLVKWFKIDFPPQPFILRKEQTSLEDCFRESVNINKTVVSAVARFKPESKDKLDVCLIKQSLCIKMGCLPEMVIKSYKETYHPVPRRPLVKVIAPGKGFKRPRLLYIPFVEQDIVDHLEMNLKHKQIYNLWGLATPYDKSIKMMIPKAPPLPPAIKRSGSKIESTGRETAFVPNVTQTVLEWHITQKKLQHNWGLPLHLQRSADAFIPPPPKLIPSQLTLCPDCEIVFSGNELGFLSEEHKETLELNTKNRIINHRWGLPKIIQTSLNSFIPPAPSVRDVMLLLKSEDVCVNTFNKADLSKHYGAFPSEHASLKMNTISSTDCKLIKENGSLNNSERVSISVKLYTKNELDVKIKPILNKSSYSTPDKTLLKLDAPCRLKKQNLLCKNSVNCLTVDCSLTSPNYRLKSMKTVDSTALIGRKLADLAYKPMTDVGLSLGPAIIGANVPSSHVTVQEELNIYLKQNIMNSLLLRRPVSYADSEEILAKNTREGGKTKQNGFCSERQCKNQLSDERKRRIEQGEEHGFCKIIAGVSVKNEKVQENVHFGLSEIMQGQPSHAGVCETEQEEFVISSQETDDGNYSSVCDEELNDAWSESLNKSYHTSRLNVLKKKYSRVLCSRFPNQTKTNRILAKIARECGKTIQKECGISSQEADDGNYSSVSNEEFNDACSESSNKSYRTSRLKVLKKKYSRTLRSRFPNQTKTNRILVKSKVTFSTQERPRPKSFKQEGGREKKCNKHHLLLSPTKELQSIARMTTSSENDQNETAHSYSSCCHNPESLESTSVSSHSPIQSERSSQCSALQRICNLAHQEALSSEDSQFTPNEVYGEKHQQDPSKRTIINTG